MSNVMSRLALKMSLLYGGFVFLLITAFVGFSYLQAHSSIEESFGLALERIVATAAVEIDGDAHRVIQQRADAASPEFRSIQAHLARVRATNYLDEDAIYTIQISDLMRPTAAVMLQKDPYTGDPYTLVAENLPKLQYVVRTKQATHTELYTDPHDTWISAYAPILDSKGEVAGILEADYRVSKFVERRDRAVMQLAGIGLAALALAILAVAAFARGLERDLQRIRAGAEHIEHGNYSHRIDVTRGDELGLVARQFNRMAEVLFERFHMLKFLPRHTLDAIERRAKDGENRETERVDASIFFSDIRGYTKMSEGLSDESVVRMLNIFLRRQAEILEEHGGTIDKYIGDAVLAVFNGPDHAEKAVAAALRIQRSVVDMNAAKAFERDVRVGIGIASGSLVLAELGSEGRRERTIIGSTVNLASRLCSHAGAGEVCVSDTTYASVEKRFRLERTDAVELKGFTGSQRCHVVGLGTAGTPPTA